MDWLCVCKCVLRFSFWSWFSLIILCRCPCTTVNLINHQIWIVYVCMCTLTKQKFVQIGCVFKPVSTYCNNLTIFVLFCLYLSAFELLPHINYFSSLKYSLPRSKVHSFTRKPGKQVIKLACRKLRNQKCVYVIWV